MSLPLKTSTAAHALLWGLAVASGLGMPSRQVMAQTATPLPPVQVDTVGDLAQPSGDNVVAGQALQSKRPGTADSAGLLRDVPGINMSTGGGVSSLPDIHGLGDDRLKVTVDDMTFTAACPNHMNPVLSYIDPTRVEKIEVWSGITPVSAGGDSIGGSIAVKSASPVFAAPGAGYHVEGQVSTFYRSVNSSKAASTSLTAADDTISLNYTGAWNKAKDYHRGGGENASVRSTLYETMNHAGTIAARAGGHLVALQGGQQFIPYEGFANQRMDLTGNRSTFANLRYEGEFDWGKIEAKTYWQQVSHAMNILSTERRGVMPMNTAAQDVGYMVKAEINLTATDIVRIGNEGHQFKLFDWWPPVQGSAMMGPNPYGNVNNGHRDRLGTFAEWESKWTPQWTTLIGLRNDMVWTDTGPVQAYSTVAPNATDAAAATRFNALNRARTDANFDMTALVRFEPAATSSNEAGYARKTRSPNLYERYAWGIQQMDSSMTNWSGDGNSYVGNPDLKPEIAHTVSVSAGLHDAAKTQWSAKLTPYYTYVEDYIGVDKIGQFTQTGTAWKFPLLKFANHDAMLYGIDFSGSAGLWTDPAIGDFRLRGVIGWAHGEMVNTGKSLYHMMPINSKTTLEHSLGSWKNAVELQLVAAKTATDTLRDEPKTPGYALINLRSAYEWQAVTINLGIDNLLDKLYYHPQGGIDYADWRVAGLKGPVGPLPAPGRSFNAGMTVKF
ncbi:Outer membrane receptor protein [Candidatus Terasakiella magnetica]|nr:Outer membrane receptor protein [Candidatus Terasakiella magnetica]